METPPVNEYARSNSLKRYGVDRWGHDFLRVNHEGHLVFAAPDTPLVDLQAVAELLHERGLRAPFVVRFPTMIAARMRWLREAFRKAAEENSFTGGFSGVYPLKVNQRRSVVDAVVNARATEGYGLEAGSKGEMLLAMAQPPVAGTLLLLNGFKDHEFLRMAFHAAELGHQVVVILESTREVGRFFEVRQEEEWTHMPKLGLRAKLYSRGSGRWQDSGGELSKFGLTTNEILSVARRLEAEGLLEELVLLHFHIGSQITRIQLIKQAAREGAWLYARLQEKCPGLVYLDLGGGIGVDYDGSRTSYPSSANYTIDEYASQVVFEIQEVVRETGCEPPVVVSESGRVLVAHHAVTIADLREVQGDQPPIPEQREDEHRLIESLRYALDHISAKNYEEYFHDAIDFRDESLTLFSSGYLGLEDRANAEGLFHQVRIKTAKIVEQVGKPSEEIVDYLGRAQRKYLVNFSIFQSIPDAWSVDHVFPAAPLSRHGERPALNARVVDLTCDSDGTLASFAHPDENLPYLPLHEPNEGVGGYYVGFFMTGAYQDSLANGHNLFSRCHEVVVRGPEDDMILRGAERIELGENVALEAKMGDTNEDVLEAMDFDFDTMLKLLRDRHLEAETTLGDSWCLGLLQSYPYLAR